MKKGLTEMVFILDKSGSMAGMESDTIGGFNSMIEKQKNLEGEAYVSTVLFSSASHVLHDRVKLEEIEPLTEKEYSVGGSTALLDAIGRAIHHIGNIHKYIREEDVPEHTIFIITTDGYENSSREYTHSDIKKLIDRQKEKYNWEFIFVASDIDVSSVAKDIGIDNDRFVKYCKEVNTRKMYSTLDDTLCKFRLEGEIDDNWASALQEEDDTSNN